MPLANQQPAPRPESMPMPFFDFQNQMREGVGDAEEAREMIIKLLEMGEKPKVSVERKFLETIMQQGGLSEKETWIPGFRALIGTLGREPYGLAREEERMVFEVTNPHIQLEPRFTGKDKKFHGIVYFPKGFIPLKDLHWQSN